MSRPLRCLGVLIILLMGAAPAAIGQDRRPILQPGKTSLFERILTRPGAELRTKPLDGAPVAVATLPPLSAFFVYDEKMISGAEWLEVGAGSDGEIDGWVETQDTVTWNQTLTLAFTNPSGRDRVLFFRDDDALYDLLLSETLVGDTDRMRALIELGAPAEDLPVISIEPAVHVDLTEQFYLLPILSAEEVYLDSGHTTRLVEIAAVTLEEGGEELISDPVVREEQTRGIKVSEAASDDYRAGIAFVIDTTTSMGPYIDRAREVVRQVYDEIEASALTGKVSFALVGFRDSIEATPDLGYRTRVFADFTAGVEKSRFLTDVAIVEPAGVSSRGFNEDSFAGIKEALDSLDWQPYSDRTLILITDAGARRSDDPFGHTGMDAEELKIYAQEKGVATYVVHLLTPEGRGNHEAARGQYQVLAEHVTAESLYHDVDTGSVDSFGLAIGRLTQSIAERIARVDAGVMPSRPETSASRSIGNAVAETATVDDSSGDAKVDALVAKSRIVGHAMMLAYLGRKAEAKAPRLFRAFAADRDFVNPTRASFDVRALLTKNQLSDLEEALGLIIEAGEAGEEGSRDFFNQIRSTAAMLSRDPNRVAHDEANNLAELGLLGEFLEDLPYTSHAMQVDEDLWLSWGPTEQQQFIDGLKSKLQLYRSFHDDTDRWVALHEDALPGDHVYPVPLDALP